MNNYHYYFFTIIITLVPSVLWRCWLGGRKGIRPVKTWVMGCWHGYLSGAKCIWLAYGPADATATPSSLLQKIQNGLSFWYRPTQVVLEKRPLNDCVCVYHYYFYEQPNTWYHKCLLHVSLSASLHSLQLTAGRLFTYFWFQLYNY